MTARRVITPRVAGMMFIAAGVLWFAAAWLGEQVAFYGIGAMFVMLGVGALVRARKGTSS